MNHCINNTDDDDGSNPCSTLFTWGPNMKCFGVNASNTMELFLGWISGKDTTHQSAVYLGHDAKHNCDLWEQQEKPYYPTPLNQTACITQQQSTGIYIPVYMHFYNQGQLQERQIFSAFDVMTPSNFPSRIFDPPKYCKIDP